MDDTSHPDARSDLLSVAFFARSFRFFALDPPHVGTFARCNARWHVCTLQCDVPFSSAGACKCPAATAGWPGPTLLGVDQLITHLLTALTACTLPQPNWDACMHRAIHHCILVRHVTSQMQLDTPLSQVVVPPSMANPEETSEEVTFAEHDWREFKKLAPQQLITIVIMTVMHLKYVRGVTLCTLCHAPPSV